MVSVILCHTILCYVMISVLLCYGILYYVMLWYVMLSVLYYVVVVCYVMLWFVMFRSIPLLLRYVTLCHVMTKRLLEIQFNPVVSKSQGA